MSCCFNILSAAPPDWRWSMQTGVLAKRNHPWKVPLSNHYRWFKISWRQCWRLNYRNVLHVVKKHDLGTKEKKFNDCQSAATCESYTRFMKDEGCTSASWHKTYNYLSEECSQCFMHVAKCHILIFIYLPRQKYSHLDGYLALVDAPAKVNAIRFALCHDCGWLSRAHLIRSNERFDHLSQLWCDTKLATKDTEKRQSRYKWRSQRSRNSLNMASFDSLWTSKKAPKKGSSNNLKI